jgi:hypothetical protein
MTVAFALGLKPISAIAITPKSAISENNILMITSPTESRDRSIRTGRSAKDDESNPRTTQHTVS